jgi:hypothetical protein
MNKVSALQKIQIKKPEPRWFRQFLLSENPALDAGFRERYAFDQKSSKP